MAVGADILDFRTAELEHTSPGSGFNGHPQTPQADSTAEALIPNGGVQHSAGEQETQPHGQRVTQVIAKPRRIHVGILVLRGPEPMKSREKSERHYSDRGQLSRKKSPITHIPFDSRGRTKVPVLPE